jgi:hypothetical protein
VASIAYIGNFRPEHSTENDVLKTLRGMGHEVSWVQEDEPAAWDTLISVLRGELRDALPIDLVLWTSTYDYAQKVGPEIQRGMQWTARTLGIPTMGFHLDRWWGLKRWERVLTEPFFRCDYVLTADGGHQAEFGAADVNHHWSPPAIAPHNAVRGKYREELACDVLFVGSWQGGYHEEWAHRPQLIKHLQRNWGKRLLLLPPRGAPRVVGQDLADAYASAKVVVGDSCLVPKADGSPMTHYCSDRVFETIGRGGLLIHPFVDGVIEPATITVTDSLLRAGEHLSAWHLGEWGELDDRITAALDDPLDAGTVQSLGRSYVLEHHTYANRLDWALGLVGL